MARYYGDIGYATREETEPGIWEDVIVERHYTGELMKNLSSNNAMYSSEINDGVRINHNFSIVADAYALSNFSNIKYITYLGQKWKVTNVEVQRPRLILTTGDLYHEG